MFGKRELLVVGLALVCISGIGFCATKAKAKPVLTKDTSVLVEAFLIGVTNEALIKSGTKPISKDHQAVSILNILWCLNDPEKAEILSQMKVMCLNGEHSEIISEKLVYSGNTEAGYIPSVKLFSAKPDIKSEDKIIVSVDYDFEESSRSQIDKFSWKGHLVVTDGVPQIAAAMTGIDFLGEWDGDEVITFLVICASIQGEQEFKKKVGK